MDYTNNQGFSFRKNGRFNRLLESIPGLTPIISMRLKDLEREGLIEYTQEKRAPMMVLWSLTEKGKYITQLVNVDCLQQ